MMTEFLFDLTKTTFGLQSCIVKHFLSHTFYPLSVFSVETIANYYCCGGDVHVE